jgi:hypothetical protein
MTSAPAHGGSRFGACFAASTPPNNDWLISPSLHIGAATWKLSMWVKAYSATYAETYNVGINTVGNTPANFTSFLNGTTPLVAPSTAWTLKEFPLSSYNGQNIYVGINCVSNDAFIFMIDDIFIGAPTNVEDQDYASGIILSPNPANSVFFLNFSDDAFNNADIIVTDMNGRTVKTAKYTQTDVGGIAIETNDMASGLYLVTVRNNNKVAVKKVSVTK